jgi:hypothetical protein
MWVSLYFSNLNGRLFGRLRRKNGLFRGNLISQRKWRSTVEAQSASTSGIMPAGNNHELAGGLAVCGHLASAGNRSPLRRARRAGEEIAGSKFSEFSGCSAGLH